MNEPWTCVSTIVSNGAAIAADPAGFRCVIDREDVPYGLGKDEKSLVLIDDSDEDALLFALAVRKSGKNVRAQRAANGAEARQLLAGQRPSLVALDCHLPGESGLELLKEIRSMESFRRVPIVMLSGTESDDDLQSAYANGANSFVRKPLSSEGYVSCVNLVLEYWLNQNCTSLPTWGPQVVR